MYVISSTEFDTLAEAGEQIKDWAEEGTLDEDARVYKVSKVYKPGILVVLEEEDD